MIQRQAKIIVIAQKHQTQVNEQYIDSKNKKYKDTEITTFPVNSYVLVVYPYTSLKKGPPNKFMTNWQGPCLAGKKKQEKRKKTRIKNIEVKRKLIHKQC